MVFNLHNAVTKNLHLPLAKSKIPPGEAGKAGGERAPPEAVPEGV
jgi:hypothetical protein